MGIKKIPKYGIFPNVRIMRNSICEIIYKSLYIYIYIGNYILLYMNLKIKCAVNYHYILFKSKTLHIPHFKANLKAIITVKEKEQKKGRFTRPTNYGK